MCMSVFCMYVWAPHLCLVPIEARRRLELQMVVSYHVGAEN